MSFLSRYEQLSTQIPKATFLTRSSRTNNHERSPSHSINTSVYSQLPPRSKESSPKKHRGHSSSVDANAIALKLSGLHQRVNEILVKTPETLSRHGSPSRSPRRDTSPGSNTNRSRVYETARSITLSPPKRSSSAARSFIYDFNATATEPLKVSYAVERTGVNSIPSFYDFDHKKRMNDTLRAADETLIKSQILRKSGLLLNEEPKKSKVDNVITLKSSRPYPEEKKKVSFASSLNTASQVPKKSSLPTNAFNFGNIGALAASKQPNAPKYDQNKLNMIIARIEKTNAMLGINPYKVVAEMGYAKNLYAGAQRRSVSSSRTRLNTCE